MDEPKKYLTTPKVKKRYDDVSSRTVDRWIKSGKFPPPDIILPNGRKAWLESTLEAHERVSVAARN
jgi:hypothetical protein